MGYVTIWGVIDSNKYGFIQKRRRVYALSILDNKKNLGWDEDIRDDLNKELKKIFIQIFQNKFTLIIGGVSFASYYFIILALSVPLALVSLIVPLRRTSTIFSSLVGGILFHETNLLKKLIITLFMIFGIILIVI